MPFSLDELLSPNDERVADTTPVGKSKSSFTLDELTSDSFNPNETQDPYTKLSPEDETKFRGWADAWTGGTTDQQLQDYDLRGAWQGVMSGEIKPGENKHLPDKFKKPNHITFSDDSQYATQDMDPGKWREDESGKWTFTVGRENLKHHTIDEIKSYFSKYEKDAKLIIPENINDASYGTDPKVQYTPEDLPQGDEIPDPEAAKPYQKVVKDNIGYLDSLWRTGVGAGEFLLTATTDLAGAFVGTLGGIVDPLTADYSSNIAGDAAPTDKEIKDFPEFINHTRETFRYEPRTVAGQTFEGMMSGLFGLVSQVGEDIGDKVFEATGSPALATAARIGPDAIVMLSPFALKGKNVLPLAQEVIDAKARATNAAKPPSIHDQKLIDEFSAVSDQLQTLRSKPKEELTATDRVAIGDLTKEVDKKGKELAAQRGLDYTAPRATESLVNKLTDKDLDAVDLTRVQTLVKEAGEAAEAAKNSGESPKGAPAALPAVEVTIDGSRTIVTKGLEELVAAQMMGNKKVLVRTTIPRPKEGVVKAMAEKVYKINEAERELSATIKSRGEKKVTEKVQEFYDLTKPLKERLKKLLPGYEAAPIIARYQQMHNAGTSAALFAKDYFEPIFKQINGEKIYDREIGGVKRPITDEHVLDEIVQSRLVAEIGKRKPNHKFAGKATVADHQARLIQLREDIGDTQFNRINGIADQVFDVYKRLLDARRAEGLITPELYDKLKNFDYEPKQHLEFFDPEIASQSGKGIRSSGVLKLRDGGYDLTEVSAKTLLHDSINRTFNIIAKNRVLAELDNAIRANPNSALAAHVKVLRSPGKSNLETELGRKPTPEEKAAYKAKKANEAAGIGPVASKLPKGFERVEFFNQGKKRALAIDPFIASVWKNKGELEALRTGTQMLRVFTGVTPVKTLAVGANPFFPIVDVPRNLIGVAFSNNVSMSGVPMFGFKNNFANTLFGLPVTAGQMLRNMALVAKDARTHGPMFRELADQGAFPQFLAQIGLQEFKAVNRRETAFGNLIGAKGSQYLDRVAEALSYPGVYAETVMRMAIAKQGELRGLTRAQQAAEALRMVNFNEAGYGTALLDNFVPFFNAGFQSTRAQLRGFKESPMRTSAMAASVMAMGSMSYLTNFLINPEAVKQISDEDLATGFNIVFPPSSSAINAAGEVVHPYVHIPASGAAVPFLTASALMMRRFNEHREPSGLLLDAFGRGFLPAPDISGSPVAAATLAIFGNYNEFRGRQLFPQDTGEPYQEYYGEHERNATPGIYVELGRRMWDSGLFGDTPLEGLTSPERLRAAVNAYIPNNPLSGAFSTIDAFADPNVREMFTSNWEILDKSPGLGALLHITNPNVNPWRDMETEIGQMGAVRFAAKRETDELAYMVAHGQLTLGEALKTAQTRFLNVGPDYREALMKRLVTSSQAQRILSNIPPSKRVGIPGNSWWASLGAQADPKERARAYYKTWLTANPEARKTMDRITYTLSATGSQSKLIDSNGDFILEFNRMKRQYGTDYVPGILLEDVDYNDPKKDTQ